MIEIEKTLQHLRSFESGISFQEEDDSHSSKDVFHQVLIMKVYKAWKVRDIHTQKLSSPYR